MNPFIRSIILLILINFSGFAIVSAQGTLRGKITDGETGEDLGGAVVRVMQGEKTVNGALADLEGTYDMELPVGDYTLAISYITFVSDTFDVTVSQGKVTFTNTILLPEVGSLEVVIEGKRNQATAVTLLNKKRNAVQAVDGVSIDLIKRTGDANVASAMQRIVGVTVEGGKYVYVRGLGDRYSKTLLNGAEIPGLDPNRNTVQMDIFPSSLVDNILTVKTFTPDLPGSFSGGLVQVNTKDFPDKFQANFSASLGYNTQSSLISNFASYETGKTDFLGFDDGTRALPATVQNLEGGVIPNVRFTNAEVSNQINDATKSFQTGMAPTFDNSTFLNQNYQFSIGNQYKVGEKSRLGFISSLTYRNTYKYYDGDNNGKIANWSNTGNASSLLAERDLTTTVGEHNVLWGGLAKISLKRPNAKYGLMYMHNQGGNDQTKYASGGLFSDDPNLVYESRSLRYQQRALDIVQLDGKHDFGRSEEGESAAKLKVNWIASIARANVNTPDLRFFNNDYTQEGEVKNYEIQLNLYPAPFRFYRDMRENHIDTRLNFEKSFNLNGRKASIKFGGANTLKFRNFAETRYQYIFGTETPAYWGDPSAFFAPQNLGVLAQTLLPSESTRNEFGLYLQDATERRNQYDAMQWVAAGYAMAVLPASDQLKIIAGARFETTQIITESAVGNDTLATHDPLPSLSLIYAVNDKMNLRAAYFRTLARPSFREFAPFSNVDYVRNVTETGNPDLERSLIDNFDLRWEFFPSPSELVSVSAYYKKFTNPIEYVQVVTASSIEFTWSNVPSATVLGAEFELRKDLSFISDKLKYFQVGGNVSVLQSSVDQLAAIVDAGTAVDSLFDTDRPLQGQSPFTSNIELAYINPLNGWTASLSYSRFAERIAIASVRTPNIYEQPRPLVNFSIQKRFSDKLSVRFRANNLLNPEYKKVHHYRGQDYIFENYRIGQTFSFSVNYQFN